MKISHVLTLPHYLSNRLAEVHNFNPKDYLPGKLAHDLDTFMQYAYVAAQEAIKQSGIESFHPYRTGIVMGTALEGLTLAVSTQEELSNRRKACQSQIFD